MFVVGYQLFYLLILVYWVESYLEKYPVNIFSEVLDKIDCHLIFDILHVYCM